MENANTENLPFGDEEGFSSKRPKEEINHEENGNGENHRYDEMGASASKRPKEEKKVDLSISTWGFPEIINSNYAAEGIKEMYLWQMECLERLENGSNLIIEAPGAAGKTLVSEKLMIQTVIMNKKKVIFCHPYKALLSEKTSFLKNILKGVFSEDREISVCSFINPYKYQDFDIAFCTIEKANYLVNDMLRDEHMSELGLIVVDELNFLDRLDRGHNVELLLAKIKFACKKYGVQIQILGLASIIPSIEKISAWLKADYYQTDFCPIKLEEHYLISNVIYDSEHKIVRSLEKNTEIPQDENFIIQLCLETMSENGSVLIFCSKKEKCIEFSKKVTDVFNKLKNSNTTRGIDFNEQGTESVLRELEELVALGKFIRNSRLLKESIKCGVAFYHSKLIPEVKDIIEAAFKQNILGVLISSTTLSAGVNLPANRVIIKSSIFFGLPLDVVMYRQMVERAGRMRAYSKGESILICQSHNLSSVSNLISRNIGEISSVLEDDQLEEEIFNMKRQRILKSGKDMDLFESCTFMMYNNVKNETEIIEIN